MLVTQQLQHINSKITLNEQSLLIQQYQCSSDKKTVSTKYFLQPHSFITIVSVKSLPTVPNGQESIKQFIPIYNSCKFSTWACQQQQCLILSVTLTWGLHTFFQSVLVLTTQLLVNDPFLICPIYSLLTLSNLHCQMPLFENSTLLSPLVF